MQPEELDELVEKLVFLAEFNGVSEDERRLLQVVKENVNKFKVAYNEALEDGAISSEDKEDLRNLWKNILLETSKHAIEDQSYSKDELRIIFNIFSVLIKKLE